MYTNDTSQYGSISANSSDLLIFERGKTANAGATYSITKLIFQDPIAAVGNPAILQFPAKAGGTYTLATTDQIPAPFLAYVGLLTQSGTDNPINTEIVNTLDEFLFWSRNDIGHYTCSTVDGFTENKTVIFSSITITALGGGTGEGYTFVFERASASSVDLKTYNAAGALADGLLNGTPVEIRVYP